MSREVCFTGCYEPQETQLASRLLHAGDVFVDVGANWGYFTLAGAHWVGAAGRVIAFEPEPRLFALLTSNLEANRLDFVKPYPTAVAAGSGRLALHGLSVPTAATGGNRDRSSGRAPADFDCETVALDDALDAAGIGTVQLTKIDVEGGEADVLTGMARGLAQGRYRYVLMECHPELLAERGLTESDCLARLLDAGYRAWLITHTPALHRRAASQSLPARELMRPYRPGEPSWRVAARAGRRPGRAGSALMRVAFLSVSDQIGGSEAMLLQILAALGRSRPSWPLHVVLPGNGPLADRAAALGAARRGGADARCRCPGSAIGGWPDAGAPRWHSGCSAPRPIFPPTRDGSATCCRSSDRMCSTPTASRPTSSARARAACAAGWCGTCTNTPEPGR